MAILFISELLQKVFNFWTAEDQEETGGGLFSPGVGIFSRWDKRTGGPDLIKEVDIETLIR